MQHVSYVPVINLCLAFAALDMVDRAAGGVDVRLESKKKPARNAGDV